MLATIKKLIPQPIKEWLRPIKIKLIDNPKKRKLFLHMQQKHKELLQQIKGKEKIKVVFLAIHKSVWKVDPVFQKMLADPFFEPIILVCPYTPYGEERMWQDMKECYEYFDQKGYPLLSAYNKEEQRWLTLEEIQPDIVFFTNPHNLTRKEYYEDAYSNYLSCYVPYFFLTTTHENDQSIYNQNFHNALWANYMPHEFSYNESKRISACKGKNVFLSGYPFIELFVEKKIYKDAWKKQNSKKIKIIFAPHHTIGKGSLQLSNFLLIAEQIKVVAEEYASLIQWSFKPHPILKSKLYLNEDWGRARTDAYYDFWKKNDYTQLDEGDYVDLFLQSDAIIHDSGSFIAEYPFVNKICGYLVLNGEVQTSSINCFGKEALRAYVKLNAIVSIRSFVESILHNQFKLLEGHKEFVSKYTGQFLLDDKPSDFILLHLKNTGSNK